MISIKTNSREDGISTEMNVNGKGADLLVETLAIIDNLHDWVIKEMSDIEPTWANAVEALVHSWGDESFDGSDVIS